MAVYGKDEASDLTASEKKALKAAMDLELKSRAEKRAAEAGVALAKKAGRPAKKAKRSMSPEGRARIAEAARKMWAKKKAGKKVA